MEAVARSLSLLFRERCAACLLKRQWTNTLSLFIRSELLSGWKIDPAALSLSERAEIWPRSERRPAIDRATLAKMRASECMETNNIAPGGRQFYCAPRTDKSKETSSWCRRLNIYWGIFARFTLCVIDFGRIWPRQNGDLLSRDRRIYHIRTFFIRGITVWNMCDWEKTSDLGFFIPYF